MAVGEPRLLRTTYTLLRVVADAQLVPPLAARVAEIAHLLSARELVSVLLPMHRYVQVVPPAPAQFSRSPDGSGSNGSGIGGAGVVEWRREFPVRGTPLARELIDAFRDVCIARMKGEAGIVFRTAFPLE